MNKNITLRELEVIKLRKQGYRQKDIANILGIEIDTVKSHIEHIKYKLGIYDTKIILEKYDEVYSEYLERELVKKEIKKLLKINKKMEEDILKRNQKILRIKEMINDIEDCED